MLSLKDLKKLDRDDLLDLVGLETRRTTAETTLPALGIFAAGLLVGVGVGQLQGGQDKLVGAINSARGNDTQTAATGSTVPPGSRTT